MNCRLIPACFHDRLLKDKPRILVSISTEKGTKFLEVIKWLMDLDVGYKIALRFDMLIPVRLWLFAY